MLTAKQRQFLKRLAHGLTPVVRVGKGGLTSSIVEETRRSLFAHELIKVRLDSEPTSRRRVLAEELARGTDAEIAGIVGKVAILYRLREEKPKIRLP